MAPKRDRMGWLYIPEKDFEYLPEGELPALVLGFHLSFSEKYPKKLISLREPEAPGREFKFVSHQTAGHMCNQHYIYGTILKPKSVDVMAGMNKLSKRWLGSDVCSPATLSDVIRYRDDLNTILKVDCESSYYLFEEAIYPIDTQHASKLTDEVSESFENDWIGKKGDFFFDGWKLFILGENCD